MPPEKNKRDLLAEIEALQARVEEAEETLRAIRNGEVDALVVATPEGDRVFSLKGAETPYRVLIESINEGAGTLTEDGIFLYANASLAEMLHISQASLIGTSLFDRAAEPCRAQLTILLERGMRENARGEVSLRTGCGSSLPVRISLRRLPADTAAGLSAVFTDISEEKKAKQTLERQVREQTAELRQAQKINEYRLAQLNGIIEQMTEGLIIFDPAGNLLEANPAALHLHGFDSVESLRRNLHELTDIFEVLDLKGNRLPPEEWPIGRILRGEKVTSYEVMIRRRDTGNTWYGSFGGAPILDKEGRMLLAMNMMSDITERKRMEDSLRQSEERYRALISASSQVLYRMSPDWSEMRQLQGGSFLADTTEPNSNWMQDYIHPDDQKRVREIIDDAIRTETVFQMKHRVKRMDGSVGWTFSRAVPMRDAAGNIVEWFGAANDITDKKRGEEERERLIKELEKTNRDLEGFTYSVSHDLRAPIRHLSIYSSLLEKKIQSSLDEKTREILHFITEGARKLGILVEQILEFSRMGRAPLAKTRVDLHALIEDFVRNYAAETKGRHIEWRVSPLPVVSGDSAMLQLVFGNLIANAVKFTEYRSKAVIEIGSAENEGHDIVYVKDNGAGFDMRYYNKLFGIFSRLHAADEFAGTGIGLANVQQIVQRHDGRVWAIGQVDEGATFYVALPREERTESGSG
ncbi:MAG: PAS domain S-box protein [Desulfobulbaceae bacterium]|nr:PAS domain S-box protein [Desulfobulbaceae bacterium]